MPNSILHKRSSTPGAVPTPAQIAVGEIVINTADGLAYIKNASGAVVRLPAKVSPTQVDGVAGSFLEQINNDGIYDALVDSGFDPMGHGHGNITSDGKIGTTGNQFVMTGEGGTLIGVGSPTSPSFTTSVATGSTTFDVFNTNATTINAFGAATTINVGAGPLTSTDLRGSLTVSEQLLVHGGTNGQMHFRYGTNTGGASRLEFYQSGDSAPDSTPTAWINANTGELRTTGTIAAAQGAASAPGFAFDGDVDTGVFSPGANSWAISTGATERVRVTSTGRVGIGTIIPPARLGVKGEGATGATEAVRVTNANDATLFDIKDDGQASVHATGTNAASLSVKRSTQTSLTELGRYTFHNTFSIFGTEFGQQAAVVGGTNNGANTGALWFEAKDVVGSMQRMMTISAIGVSVGTTTTGSRLVVQGSGVTTATSALNVLNLSGASMLFVRNDGNVGIGTVSPAAKLDVAGVVAATQLNIGDGNVLDAAATNGSILGGTQAKASLYGEVSHAAGGFGGVAGTAQHRILVARGITLSGAFSVSIGSPAVFTRSGHSLSVGDTVKLSTTGALPTGLNTTATYHVISAGLTGSTFQLSATANGSPISTSGTQSGTHTLVPTTSLTLNGATGLQAPARLVIPERSTWSYTVKISAYSSQNNQGGAWWAVGGLRRNLSTTVELETTQGYQYLENAFNTTPPLVSVDADTINSALDIRVTGIANQSVRWAAVVDLVQVSFGTP